MSRAISTGLSVMLVVCTVFLGASCAFRLAMGADFSPMFTAFGFGFVASAVISGVIRGDL